MSDPVPHWRGHIERDPADGQIRGVMRDPSGWPVRLELRPAHSGTGFDVDGFLGEPPVGGAIK